MTILGKVLVYVNLLFSLVVAFFITQSYVKRTQWKTAYDNAVQVKTAAEAQRDQYMKEAHEATDNGNKMLAKERLEKEKVLQDKNACDAAVKDLRAQLEKQKETIAKYNLGTGGHQTEVERLSKRSENLEKMLADANKRLDDQAKTVEDFRQRAVKAEIDNKSLVDRNNELLRVVMEKEQDLIRVKSAPGGAAVTSTTSLAANNPPPGDVSGRVKRYDPTSGLIEITIGSDAGILKGHTLQVYRLEPNGQYVGVMRILEVKPTEAVGKMINRPRTPVQVNDKVASKIS
jgi:hypothetical protein